MIVRAVKTRKVTPSSVTLVALVDEALTALPERSVLAISAKVVSLCEGRVAPKAGTDLQQLVRDEAEWYMPKAKAQHGYTFTIAHNMLTPNSGIDESNAAGMYALWPADPQTSANQLRRHLRQRFQLKEFAVVLVDGDFLPLRWGAVGLSLAYSGLEPVWSYAGQLDLFGRPLNYTRTNVADGLATTAAFVMGEGAEQTPLVVFEDAPRVTFVDHDPTAAELAARRTPLAEDSFGPLLSAMEWRPGGKHSSS